LTGFSTSNFISFDDLKTKYEESLDAVLEAHIDDWET